MLKSILRPLRRKYRNWLLGRRHRGLRLGSNVNAINCEFGRFNMICDGTVISSTSLGDYSYVGVNGRISRATIGKFCSIGPNVSIAPGMHPTDFVSTHPVFYSTTFNCDQRFSDRQRFEETGTVKIGHDVWIGNRATILDGVTIGTGAIIAAHSIVNKDVPPYAIVGGTPAKLIRPRFTEDQAMMLLDTKWWDQDDQFFRENVDCFASKTGIDMLLQELRKTKVQE